MCLLGLQLGRSRGGGEGPGDICLPRAADILNLGVVCCNKGGTPLSSVSAGVAEGFLEG